MTEKPQPVRGTHDLLPEDSRKYHYIVNVARWAASLYGYGEIISPIFEFSDVFHRTLGDTSDVVTKETYTFTDRGGDSITLRPEFTASLARAFISNNMHDQLPVKWFYAGPAFRYERPQKGRQRQFNQFGVELLGVDDPLADAECIAIAWHIFNTLGLHEKVTLELNTLGDAQSRASYREALVSHFTKHRDKLSEDSRVRLEKNPLRILDSKDMADRAIAGMGPSFDAFLSPASKDFYARVKEGLELMHIPFTENPRLVRGLDYYNHTVFEFTCADLGAQSTVLAGGRYDGLIGGMGGQDVPGVGWAAGIERLMIALEPNLTEIVRPPRPVAVIPIGESMEKRAFHLAQFMRAAGLAVEMGFKGNLGKRMKKASDANAWAAVLLGEEEMKTNEMTVKLLDTGEQHRVPEAQILEKLSELAAGPPSAP